MYGYVYLTTNLINKKKYIGMHKSSTFDETYKGSGKILKQAFEKYGWNNFKTEVLEWCEAQEDLSLAEAKLIEKYDATNNSDFYNIKEGGLGGYKVNGVSIKKGTKISEQARVNTSNAHKGIKLSEDHKKKISLSLRGDNNPLRREGSEVARKKLSESMKNNKNGEGHFWITDGVTNKRAQDLNEIPKGWHRGQTNPGYSRYKYCLVTLNKENKKIREECLDEYISKGYKRGRYIPPHKRATTIESIGNEKAITE